MQPNKAKPIIFNVDLKTSTVKKCTRLDLFPYDFSVYIMSCNTVCYVTTAQYRHGPCVVEVAWLDVGYLY